MPAAVILRTWDRCQEGSWLERMLDVAFVQAVPTMFSLCAPGVDGAVQMRIGVPCDMVVCSLVLEAEDI